MTEVPKPGKTDPPSGGAGSDRRARRRKKRLQRLIERAPRPASRRVFLVQGLVFLLAGAAVWRWKFLRTVSRVAQNSSDLVRPPTASADDAAFQRACIRCGLCGTVCENGCIRYFGLDETEHGALTPHLDVRQRACTLCMRCTNICPSGALTPVEDDLETIASVVSMGKAEVDPEHCISYLGRICGYCHDACPIPRQALHLTPPALPAVQDGCVGCGRCVEFCPQEPTAISIKRRA